MFNMVSVKFIVEDRKKEAGAVWSIKEASNKNRYT